MSQVKLHSLFAHLESVANRSIRQTLNTKKRDLSFAAAQHRMFGDACNGSAERLITDGWRLFLCVSTQAGVASFLATGNDFVGRVGAICASPGVLAVSVR